MNPTGLRQNSRTVKNSRIAPKDQEDNALKTHEKFCFPESGLYIFNASDSRTCLYPHAGRFPLRTCVCTTMLIRMCTQNVHPDAGPVCHAMPCHAMPCLPLGKTRPVFPRHPSAAARICTSPAAASEPCGSTGPFCVRSSSLFPCFAHHTLLPAQPEQLRVHVHVSKVHVFRALPRICFFFAGLLRTCGTLSCAGGCTSLRSCTCSLCPGSAT